MVPLYEICIRRDAHTVTPVTVPEYEVPLLQEIFGVENVLNREKKRVDENGPGCPEGQFQPSGDEYERFCAKYGVELVELVFGKSKAVLAKQVRDAGKNRAKTSGQDGNPKGE